MRHLTTIRDEQRVIDFATAAGEFFKDHPDHWTYTHGQLEAGCLFAARWGMDRDCVMVFRLDEDFQPVIFQQVMPKRPKTT